ncbi:unnamed protein product, partial [Porites evermanni]
LVASTNSEQDNSDLVGKLDLEGHFTNGSSPLNADLLSELSTNRGFKLAALNITSIPGHIEGLRIYMNSKCIDILAVNETLNILGDLNCNVAACPLESHTKNLLEICNLYQYHQLINEHTRITEKSATTIDLFLTNNKEIFTHSGVCHIGISDHSLIYRVRKFFIPKGKPKIVESRQFRNFDANSFQLTLT